MKPRALVVMGVSGSGKTTVGLALAARLGWPFYDADDFHSEANVAKMRAGLPLNDADRAPWLASLHDLIARHLANSESMILACSALKKSYRDALREGQEHGVLFVHLDGAFELIERRMAGRDGHYMPSSLLASQFAALEFPERALVLEAAKPVTVLVEEVVAALASRDP